MANNSFTKPFSMKNLLVFAFLPLACFSSAQNTLDPGDFRLKKNEWYLSYGPPGYSGTEAGISFTYGITDNKERTPKKEEHTYLGTIQVGYQRLLGKRLMLGLEIQFNRVVINGSTSNVQDYFRRTEFLQPQLRLDYRYISRPKFQMYSGIALGLMFSKDRLIEYDASGNVVFSRNAVWKFNSDGVPYHLNLLGFRFGRKTAFFTEMGLGFNSLARVGLTSRF